MNNLMNVLIVEDESAIRNLISTALETNGYNFEMATNGSMALSLLVKHQFDIRKYINNNKNAIPLIVRYFVDFAAINIHLSLHLQ